MKIFESIPDDFWSLFYMPDNFWQMPLQRKILSRYFNTSLGVVRSLPWGSCGLAERRLPQMQVVGSNPTEDKFVFHILLYFIVECKELFCKTNIKF